MKFERTKPGYVPKNAPVHALPKGQVDPKRCPFKGCKYTNENPHMVRVHIVKSHQING